MNELDVCLGILACLLWLLGLLGWVAEHISLDKLKISARGKRRCATDIPQQIWKTRVWPDDHIDYISGWR